MPRPQLLLPLRTLLNFMARCLVFAYTGRDAFRPHHHLSGVLRRASRPRHRTPGSRNGAYPFACTGLARIHQGPPPHRGRSPFGGGEGMVLKPEPLFEAVESLLGRAIGDAAASAAPDPKTAIVLTSAAGKPFTQATARRYAALIASSLSVGVTKEWTSGWHSIWQLKKYRLATSS